MSSKGDPASKGDITQTAPSERALESGSEHLQADTVLSLSPSEPPSSMPQDDIPVPGSLIDGKYEVVHTLGVGGMGLVVRARDVSLERDVAVKLIRAGLVPNEDVRARFSLEARTMARLRHENIVLVHAFGQLPGGPYFVMEYVPGTDLESVVKGREGEPFPLHEALRFLTQIGAAIDHIHEAGAVHRDLKPSNVLIGSGLRVVVTDLGLAHLVEQPIADRYAIAGTPGYIPPELIWAGSDVDAELLPRADVYALAVIAFELLVGRMPFIEPSVTKLLRKQRAEAPPIASELNERLGAEVCAVLQDGLAKDPRDRIATAGELIRRLSSAQNKLERHMLERHVGMRIVVADDDEDVRELAAAILEEAYPEADVEAYADGALAFAALESGPASLAVVDLHMPGLDGIELTARLRAGRHKSTPIIVMTAVGGASDWKVLSELGANAFLVKPFDEDALVLAARRVLGFGSPRRSIGG